MNTKRQPLKCECGFICFKCDKFERHLKSSHNIDSIEEGYIKMKCNGTRPLCTCGCALETTWINWNKGYSKFIVGHNGDIYNIYDKEVADSIAQKRKDKLIGRKSWSKGLTKETDKRIKERAIATSIGRKKAFDSNELEIWSKGLTKDIDVRLMQTSNTLKNKFSNGELVPWTKGKSKHTDSNIMKMSMNVSIALNYKALRNRLDDLKRLSDNEIKSRIERTGRLDMVNIEGQYVNDNTQNISVSCKICNTRRLGNLRSLQHGRCYNCDPKGSAEQQEVVNFMLSLGESVDTNCKSLIYPQEIDIFVKNKNFAIEYNGTYWHSELRKSNMYHENKTLLCKMKGVQLMHVFDDEWNEKQDIIKSLIKHRLGKDDRKIGARKCKIFELTKDQRYSFFESNHIDGDVVITNKSWGLIYENEIVAAISVRKPFHKSNQNMLEIARFCTSKNTSVVGGLAKLTKVALKYASDEGYSGLITYVDTRFGTGKGYEVCGFKYKRKTPPRFWWYHDKSKTRLNRFKYRASKADGLSEKEVAKLAEVVKVWGCSNLVYELSVF